MVFFGKRVEAALTTIILSLKANSSLLWCLLLNACVTNLLPLLIRNIHNWTAPWSLTPCCSLIFCLRPIQSELVLSLTNHRPWDTILWADMRKPINQSKPSQGPSTQNLFGFCRCFENPPGTVRFVVWTVLSLTAPSDQKFIVEPENQVDVP